MTTGVLKIINYFTLLKLHAESAFRDDPASFDKEALHVEILELVLRDNNLIFAQVTSSWDVENQFPIYYTVRFCICLFAAGCYGLPALAPDFCHDLYFLIGLFGQQR